MYGYRESLSDLEDFELPTAAVNVTDETGKVAPFGNLGKQMNLGSINIIQR